MNDAPRTHHPSSMKERAIVLGVGLLGNQVLVWTFDYVLYPYVMWRFGLLHGCLIMTALSALPCYLTLLFYDWSKKDWLGIEAIKEFKEEPRAGRMSTIIREIMRRGDLPSLVAMSIYFDPFITTAYMRQGSYHFNGMASRDWRVFWMSVVIANVYWSFAAFAGVSIFQWAWNYLLP